MSREPIAISGAVASLIVALFTIAAVFGLDISSDTQEKILTGAVSIVGALLVLVPFFRSMVYSPASAKQIEQGAQPAPMDAAPPHPLP